MTVYFATCRDANAVKIGYSGDAHLRARELQSCCPLPIKIEALLPGTKEIEATFHARFADDRIHGEWFHITQMIEAIIAANPPTDRPKINPRYRAPRHNRTLPARIRAQLGVTQTVMAEMVGIRPQELRGYERGYRPFRDLPEALERKFLALVEELAA